MIIRLLEVDLVTGAMSSLESNGALTDTYDTMRERIESTPGKVMIALSEETALARDTTGMAEADVAGLVPPEQAVVRLPYLNEIEPDMETGWIKAAPRPSFEEAMGKTKAELVADMVTRGAPLAWATTTVDAREGEYDAYDPLEGVHPYGTPIEDIAQAAIVAAERRAARRAG